MYSAIGGMFEYLNGDCGYEKWSQYLIEKLASLGAGCDGADVGCGNGYFTRALCRAGYEVLGVDISPEALNTAITLSRSEGVQAEFLCGDITKLRLGGKVSFITAVNDCLNYVPREKLAETFKRVNKNLKNGGLFLFDISSPEKLKNTVGNNTFVKDLDRATVIWCNTLFPDRVEMDITLFTLNADGTYSRSDESQTQYIHEEEQILALLRGAGFEAQTEPLPDSDKSERINFICRKL